jgi:hypothetical protein
MTSSANAFRQALFLIQPIDFRSLEISARDDAPDPAGLDNRDVTEAPVAYRSQRINGALNSGVTVTGLGVIALSRVVRATLLPRVGLHRGR